LKHTSTAIAALAFAFTALLAAAPAHAETTKPEAAKIEALKTEPARAETKDQEYLAMVEKIRAKPNSSTEDWATLRGLYIQTSFYDPYGGAQSIWYGLQRIGQRMVEAPESTDVQKAYDELLTRHFAHYRAHLQAIDLAEKNHVPHINKEEQLANFNHIIAAIGSTGDGKTEQTAYHVIDPAEEMMIMKIKRIQPTGQDFRQKDGHFWDVQMYGDPRDPSSRGEVFFNVDDILRSGAGKR